MTTLINASTSAGLVQTADTSGNLSLQSGGTTILALTSAGAAITGTLSVTGKITKTNTASTLSNFLTASGSTTGAAYLDITNTSGGLIVGIDNNVGGASSAFWSSAGSAYASAIVANTELNLGINGSNPILKLISTGLAVTGTLSSTSTTSLCTTSGTILDVGTADINIGFAKTISILAPAAAGAIVAKTVEVGYPVLAGWNAANAGDNVFTYWYVNTAGDNKGSIGYNRTANLVAYNTTSDATLKNLIGDAPQARSLEILSQTRLREYSWKSDETNKPQIGVIAQELVEVFPGAVSVGGDLAGTDEDGNPTTKYHPWSVDKTAYQFHLVAGWQSHEAKIAALEARLAALEAK